MGIGTKEPPYDPTPEEIKAGCARIRLGWSPGERRRRGAWMEPDPWEAPAVAAEDLFGEADRNG